MHPNVTSSGPLVFMNGEMRIMDVMLVTCDDGYVEVMEVMAEMDVMDVTGERGCNDHEDDNNDGGDGGGEVME